LQTGKGQTQDLQESHLWLKKAAKLGHHDAAMALANTTEN
jgi:TPR repeat protein